MLVKEFLMRNGDLEKVLLAEWILRDLFWKEFVFERWKLVS
jgi:hypothetical protein